MKLTIYAQTNTSANTIDRFMDLYYSLQMCHLASELFDKGFTPPQLSRAIAKAIQIAENTGLPTERHFKPIYLSTGHSLYSDYKLSKLGLGLVLLNGDLEIPSVQNFQIQLLKSTMGKML